VAPASDTIARVDLGIEGKAALVTGASKGIGRAIAAALVDEGARVAVSSRSRGSIEATADDIGATAFVHDSEDVDAAGALVHQVEQRLGPVEILVTNTGGPPGGADGLAFTRAQWDAAYCSLVLSPMALIDAAAPGMRERRWGRIVNVSSMAVREVIDALLLSNAHRAAMLAAFKTLARQLAGEGVTLNTVLPGRIATDRLAVLYGSLEAAEDVAAEQVPAGRLGRPEEMAAAAVFLCSQRAAYITGTTLLVDGGLTRSP
jgi:3-oxoacyl-[acyl-carrier protein] reductase